MDTARVQVKKRDNLLNEDFERLLELFKRQLRRGLSPETAVAVTFRLDASWLTDPEIEDALLEVRNEKS